MHETNFSDFNELNYLVALDSLENCFISKKDIFEDKNMYVAGPEICTYVERCNNLWWTKISVSIVHKESHPHITMK